MSDDQLFNLSKWKYLLILIFSLSVSYIIKENLKLKRSFDENFGYEESNYKYNQNTGKGMRIFYTYLLALIDYLYKKSNLFLFINHDLNFWRLFYF